MRPKQLKNYVSETDKFLGEWDKAHPQKSEAQEQEIQKYQRIFKLRDKAMVEEKPKQKSIFDFE